MQECEDGGAGGGVPGVKIASLQNHFYFGACGDEFRGEVDEGVVRYGLIKKEISRTTSLGKRVAISKVLDRT